MMWMRREKGQSITKTSSLLILENLIEFLTEFPASTPFSPS